MSAMGDSVRETGRSLRTVASNAGLRRVNLALAGSMIGDWAYATAVVVWAYQIGGATLVGVWYVVRLALMALVTPFASTFADRFSRTRVMVTSDLVRAGLVTVAAVGVFWNWPVIVVLVVATVTALVGSPFRPAQMSLLPGLAETPEELTAANGVSSTVESLAFFLGPAIGGLLLGVADIPVVFLFDALTFLWSALLVSRVKESRAPVTEPVVSISAAAPVAGSDADPVDDNPPAGPDVPAREGFVRQSVVGFGVIWRHPGLRMMTGLYCAQTVVAGASAVFVVTVARELLTMGPQGVGYLNSAFGVGALMGGVVAVARATQRKLARDFGIGVVLWALPLAAIWLWPSVPSALLALAVMGGANSVVDVNAVTILQRMTPEPVMARVFGALDTGLIGTMALGALIMSPLISIFGIRWALLILAVVMSVLVLPAFPGLRRIDGELREPEALPVLRTIPLFSPLGEPLLQTLAQRITRREVTGGETVIEEGQPGEEFFVIGSGRVEVTQAGRRLREEGPGDFFGEIALLRDVPRTATVTASEPTVLYVLGREDFLDALTGNLESEAMAEDVVTRRLMT